MKRLKFLGVILILIGGFCFWWFSPNQVLKRKTVSLLTTLTMPIGDGKAKRHLGSYSLNGLLASQVELETPTISEANGTFEREELESVYSWLCDEAKQTRFEMQKLRKISVNGESATVEFDLTAMAELPTYRPADGGYRVTFNWVNGKDGWRLARAVWNKYP